MDARGFSAAQIVLNVSASTISRQMSDLEARLGMRLCQRGRKGFRLTDKGEIIYTAARKLFDALDQFKETVDGTSGELVGRLSIGAIDNWVFNDASPLKGALAQMTRIAPKVAIEIQSLAPDDIEISLQNGRISIGLGVFHSPKSTLTYEHLGYEKIGLYCSRDHPLFKATDARTIDDHLAKANYCRRAYLNESTVAPITSELSSNASAHQIEGVAMMILTGQYIGYLPESFADVWVRQGRMKSVAKRRFDLKSQIQLVLRRGAEPNLVERTFIDFVRKESESHRAKEQT